jgi:uncharacterized ion transporter superfamily protein YfcC
MLVWIPVIVAAWFAVGALVAVPFLLFAVGGAVEGAKGSSLAFRLMMLPASALLWPIVVRLWLGSRTGVRHS